MVSLNDLAKSNPAADGGQDEEVGQEAPDPDHGSPSNHQPVGPDSPASVASEVEFGEDEAPPVKSVISNEDCFKITEEDLALRQAFFLHPSHLWIT